MGWNRIKSISFTKRDRDVYEYLGTKRNASQYVTELIRRDMERREDSLEAKVVKIVRSILQESNLPHVGGAQRHEIRGDIEELLQL